MARTKALQNVGITYDGDNLQPHLNTATLNATVEAIESTTFASSAMEQGRGAVVLGGHRRAVEQDARRLPAAGRGYAVRHAEDARLLRGPSGSRVTYTWTASGTTTGAFISNYTINADNPMGDITWSGTLTVSGAPTIS